MAGRKTRSTRRKSSKGRKGTKWTRAGLALGFRRLLRWLGYVLAGVAGLFLLLVVLFAFVNPPTTPYIFAESRRLGGVDRQWVDLEDISPNLIRAIVAAEDANFCLHWGFDMGEIRKALEEGADRGASTITQQTAKNLFLWQGRSWPRKAMEALLTPLVEAVWTKRRIIEVYVNIAEFGDGVFGAEAAARKAFGSNVKDLSLSRAARLAAILPDPKNRSAANPTAYARKRAAQIAQGAETIRADGRDSCLF